MTGLKVRTILRRIQFGLPIEGPARYGPAPRRFEFRGRLATISEIMAETGLSRSQVGKRTDGQRFFERHELKDPNAPLPDGTRKLFFRGILDSVSGWARRTGIPRSAIDGRLDMGWSVERALIVPVKSEAFDTITFRGETKTFLEWSRATGIDQDTLHSRIRVAGWSVERALTEPVRSMKERALYKRNAKLIARMLEGFHAPTTTTSTGGCSQTFTQSQGTGVGSSKTDFEGASA
ncbi:hypothetical protein [Antarcticirhabdus aurantiaca]|uniref:Uncharacterized protein n=1 Tax=Antarcticirhabdus aurantiaca TaxID=2606717 RepID=A0ACD4NHG3_9HYPH|nr:hypothetical protein OXU80_15350 [Jeongeuplla avenae]